MSTLTNLAQVVADAAQSTDAGAILHEIIDAISEGFVLYDADDRLVLCNQKYRDIYALSADVIVPGNSFEQIVRTGAERGQYAEAIGQIDQWIAERVRLHRNPSGSVEQLLSDGRWLRITEHKTPSGWVAGLRVDITELKRAEAAARQREERYRRLVERTNAIAYSYRVGDDDLSYVAPQAAKLLGHPVDELMSGQFWFDHMHPDDRPEVQRRGAAMAQDQRDHSLEYRMTTGDGQMIWVRDIVTFDHGPDGALVAHGIIVDITEQKKTEHALAESEARFRTIADTIPGMLWVTDANDRTIFVNRQWRDYTGWQSDDAISETRMSHVHPDDIGGVTAAAKAGWQARQPYTVTYRLRRHDGEYRWFVDTGTPRIAPDGGFLGYIGAALDITEQKRAEAATRESETRFRAMADTMPALLWVADPEEKTVFVNKPWLDYTGRPLEDELGYGSLDDIHPEDRERTIAAFATACENREPVTLEYRLLGKDGQCQWVLDTSTPRFAPDGEYLGHIGVLVDIDERRQLQTQLAQAQKMEAVGQLTGGVAHDFNNLLTVITLNLQLIDGSLDSADQRKEMIGAVLHAAGRGAELTHQLLAFSRRQVLTPKVVDVNELVAGMDGLLRRTLVEAIRVESVHTADLWLTEVDPGQLETALLNLAINARDAMPGGGALTIETANVLIDADYASRHQDVAPGPYVMLAVSDTGTGMSQQTIEHAFEPFYTTKEVGKGSGLGLSMVQGFMKQSGGHVKIYSELGVGTTVKLHLPRASETAREASAEVAEIPQDEATVTETVLVVEDNQDLRAAAVTVLTGLGYRVLQAADGASALVVVGDHPGIDLLFTDVIMPGGMNGAALAAAVRERRPGIKVLYTSGYAENAILHNGHLDEGAEWIAKPYRAIELAHKIRQALEA